MAIFQSKSLACLCVFSNGGAKRTELNSAGEDSSKNVDAVPLRATQPCVRVALRGARGGAG